jgi:putative transposase
VPENTGEELSVSRRCELLGISRSGYYYRPREPDDEDYQVMKLIDRQYLETPFYGARKMAVCLKRQGYTINRKRVRRLMSLMGLRAIYRRPRTSTPATGHKVIELEMTIH